VAPARLALGLSKYLPKFAAAQGAKTYFDVFAGKLPWSMAQVGERVIGLIDRARVIHFNMEGMRVPVMWGGMPITEGVTNWELNHVLRGSYNVVFYEQAVIRQEVLALGKPVVVMGPVP
jgi:hypothetical protein